MTMDVPTLGDESPFPEPPFPGFDQYEGDLRYSSHAVRDRMLRDGHTDADVRMVLANPTSIKASRNPQFPTRFVVEGVCRYGVTLRVVLDHDALNHEYLWVASVFALDTKPVQIKAPARAVWRLWFSLDRLTTMAAVVKISRPDKKGRAVVTIADPMVEFQNDAVRAVRDIIEEGGADS